MLSSGNHLIPFEILANPLLDYSMSYKLWLNRPSFCESCKPCRRATAPREPPRGSGCPGKRSFCHLAVTQACLQRVLLVLPSSSQTRTNGRENRWQVASGEGNSEPRHVVAQGVPRCPIRGMPTGRCCEDVWCWSSFCTHSTRHKVPSLEKLCHPGTRGRAIWLASKEASATFSNWGLCPSSPGIAAAGEN